MYCENCGKPIEEGQTLCPECSVAKAPTPETAPIVETPAAAPAEALFELNLTGEEAPKTEKKEKKAKKEKKPGKKLFGKIPVKAVVGGILALLLAAVLFVGFYFFGWWYYITDFFARTFQSPEEYKNTVEENALTREDSNSDLMLAKRGLVKVYGALLTALGNGDGTAAISLRGELDEELASMLNMALAFQGGENMSTAKNILQTVRKVNVDIDLNQKDGVTRKDYDIAVNGQDIFGIQDITDNANHKQYFAVTDQGAPINDYICYDLNTENAAITIEDLIAMAQTLPGEEGFSAMLDAFLTSAITTEDLITMAQMLPSEEEFSTMLDAFLMSAIREIDDVEMDSATLDAAGIEQTFTVLTYNINAKTRKNISQAILKEAATNPSFRKFLNVYIMSVEKATGVSLPIEDVLTSLASSPVFKTSSEDEETTVIETYVDRKGFIQGRKITTNDPEAGKTQITYLTASGFLEQGFFFRVSDNAGTVIKFEGSAALEDGVIAGSYDLYHGQQKVLTAKLKNFSLGTLDGTIEITLSKDFVASLNDTYPLLAFVDLSKAMLKVDLAEDSVDVAAYMSDKQLLSVGLSISEGIGNKITIPGNAVSTSDTQAFHAVQAANNAFLRERLENAGLGNLYDVVESLFPKVTAQKAN